MNNAELNGEVLLASQTFEPPRYDHQALRRLMVALLEDAIRTYQRHLFAESKKGRRRFREAETWLMDDHPDAALHFQDVCDALDLDADFLRTALQRWQASEVARAAPERPPPSAKAGRVTRLETARRERLFALPRSRAPREGVS